MVHFLGVFGGLSLTAPWVTAAALEPESVAREPEPGDQERIVGLGDRAEAGDHEAVAQLVQYWQANGHREEELPPESEGFRSLLLSAYFLCRPGVASDQQLGEVQRLDLLEAKLRMARRVGGGDRTVELEGYRDLARELCRVGDFEAYEKLEREGAEHYSDRPTLRVRLHRHFAMVARDLVPRDFLEVERQLDEASYAIEEVEAGVEATRLRAALMGDLASFQLAVGNVDLARNWLDELQELAASLDDSRLKHIELIQRCNLHLGSKRLGKVESATKEALEADEPLPPATRATLWMLRGTGLSESSRDHESLVRPALAAFRECLKIEGGSRLTKINARARLTLLLVRHGEPGEALGELERLDEQAAEYERVHRRPLPTSSQSAIGVIQSQLGRGSAEELRDDLEQRVTLMLEEWSGLPRLDAGTGFLHYIGRLQVISELVTQTLRVQPDKAGRERALEWLIQVQARGSLAREAGYEFKSLQGLRSLLFTKERGALVYLAAHDSSHLFVIDSKEIWHHELPRWRVLDDRVRDFVGHLNRSESRGEAFKKSSLLLADSLLPPAALEQMKDWEQSWVVSQGLIGYVPFELLPVGEEELLRDRQDVCYLPSLPVGEFLARRAVKPRKKRSPALAMLIDPKLTGELQAELPRFQLTKAELGGLSRTFEGRPSFVRFGEDASLAALRSPEVAQADVLQLFVHGYQFSDRTPSTALALAPSGDHKGLVGCAEVGALNLPPIVIFSSCGAAQGVLRRGEDGIGHLGGAALGAGARVAILSPACLELEPMIAVMTELHAGLLERGESPARALAGALEYLRTQTSFTDPAHARVHVFGLGHEL